MPSVPKVNPPAKSSKASKAALPKAKKSAAAQPSTPPPTPPSNPVRVLIAEDHPLTRDGMALLVRETPGFELYGEVADSAGVILAVDSDPPPDMILLDLMLGNEDGIELIKRVRKLRPGLPVLVVSAYSERIYAELAMKAGALGYLMKEEQPGEVLRAMESVVRGERYFSPQISLYLSSQGEMENPYRMLLPAANPPLSSREFHIYQLIGLDKKTSAIAEALGISIKTVETHREHIKAKLGLRTAAELVKSAREWVDRCGDARLSRLPSAQKGS